MRVPEEEDKLMDIKSEHKKKTKKVEKKKEVKAEETEKKVEAKPIPVTLYEVSLSDFLKSIEISFDYDKLLYELGVITCEDSKKNITNGKHCKKPKKKENSKKAPQLITKLKTNF